MKTVRCEAVVKEIEGEAGSRNHNGQLSIELLMSKEAQEALCLQRGLQPRYGVVGEIIINLKQEVRQ